MSPTGKPAGKITGKTAGVSKDVLAFLQAVADHYGVTLKIKLGKTQPKRVAEDMLNSWGPRVWKGPEFPLLGIRGADLKAWNDLYDQAVVRGDSNAYRQFVQDMTGRLVMYTGHATGVAVDLDKGTPKNVRAALKTGMFEFAHSKGLHYDALRRKPPKVTEKLRAKWKK